MTASDVAGNPFALVAVVRQRATEILCGAEPRVRVRSGENPVATAMREVSAGVVEVSDGK